MMTELTTSIPAAAPLGALAPFLTVDGFSFHCLEEECVGIEFEQLVPSSWGGITGQEFGVYEITETRELSLSIGPVEVASSVSRSISREV